MADKPATPAVQALGSFRIDGYMPFYTGDASAIDTLLSEAHGILKVLGVAYSDHHQAQSKGVEGELQMLNGRFVASALNGASSLIALAMFLQEQGQ